MYEAHFDLSRRPFCLSPDISFYYAGKTHNNALSYLEYGLDQNEGVIVLTGDPGTGKTTLLKKLEGDLSRQFYVAHISISPEMRPQELLKLVTSSFCIKNTVELDEPELLLLEIRKFLIAQTDQNRRVIVFVDKCHHLTYQSMEELRQIAKIHYQGTPLIQCFLVGQSSFRNAFEAPELEQLNQLIIASCHLTSLSEKETNEYILHQLVAAGHRSANLFTPAASQVIHKFTSGIPRRINRICDRALHYASLENKTSIDEEMILSIIDELSSELLTSPPLSRRDFETKKHELSQHNRGKRERRIEERRKQNRRVTLTVYPNKHPDNENNYPLLNEAPTLKTVVHEEKASNIIKKSSNVHLESKKPRFVSLRFPIDEFFRIRNRMKSRNKDLSSIEIIIVLAMLIPTFYFTTLSENNTAQETAPTVNSIIMRSELKNVDSPPLIANNTIAQPSPTDDVPIGNIAIENSALTEVKTSMMATDNSESIIKPPHTLAIAKTVTEKSSITSDLATPAKKVVATTTDKKQKIVTVEKDTAKSKVKASHTQIAKQTKEEPKNRKPTTDTQPISVKPAPTQLAAISKPKPVTPPATIKPTTIDPRTLDLVINKFTGAYKIGDIEGLSSVLSNNIKTNDSSDKDTLTSQYEKLFSITDDRDLKFTNVSWKTETSKAAGKGKFEAIILEKGRATPQTYSGTFTIELKKEDTQLAITDMRYEYE